LFVWEVYIALITMIYLIHVDRLYAHQKIN
jgi:hypothetical protein